MADEISPVPEEVARQVYPVAVSQARWQVIIQLAVIAAFVLLWAVLGLRSQFACIAGTIIGGAIATAYDIRWWLWLRQANPVEAFARVQSRDGREGGSFRSGLTVVVTMGFFALWWLVGK